jgi:asparagine synthase (glutamine-hydrolysing)
MCGFVCVVAGEGRFEASDLSRSVASLRHRGPDAQRVERFPLSGGRELWFGHARLSIVDLSAAGDQPMHLASGDREGVLVYNGEVFNHRELRTDIARRLPLHSTGDTELLLAGLLLDGPRFLELVNGMFALTLFDKSDSSLLVARDRLGKKPLYVYQAHGVLAFASELKAFHALGLPLTIDEDSFAYFRWLGYVPAERAIYKECRKFPAASWARLDLRSPEAELRHQLFWNPLAAMAQTYVGSYDDGVAELSELLSDATRLRVEADVPVGVFLSGGIDSSLVAACTLRDRVAHAYVVQPNDKSIDESEVALRTAARLGLHATTTRLSPEDYPAQLSTLPWFYDEPLADLSQLAVLANARSARQDVVVVLTGDGGDEVFLGYPWMRYPETFQKIRRSIGAIPGAVKLARSALLTPLGKRAIRWTARLLGRNGDNADVKARFAHTALSDGDPSQAYEFFMVNHLRADLSSHDREVIGSASMLTHARSWYPRYDWAAAESRSIPELLGALEMVTYMRDAILTKVDRGTMAHSVEARCPLLDYRVVELGMRMPVHFKIGRGAQKRILREVCERFVGSDVARLKKQGFAIELPASISKDGTWSAQWNAQVEALWRGQWTQRGDVDSDRTSSALADC